MYYHATPMDHGAEFAFDTGGFHEQVVADTTAETPVRGTVQTIQAPTGFGGFQKSDTAELCVSCSPEAAVFAVLQNIAGSDDRADEQEREISVYGIEETPDVDLSGAVVGDFAFIEEMRYRNLEERPIDGERIATPTVPDGAIRDVNLAYLPPSPHMIETWGETTKQRLRTLVDEGVYPSLESVNGEIEQPDPEAYQRVR